MYKILFLLFFPLVSFSQSVVYNNLININGSDTTYTHGTFNFNHHDDVFRVTYKGTLYLNTHAKKYAQDTTTNTIVYLVNPNSFIYKNPTSLVFTSDDEENIMIFY